MLRLQVDSERFRKIINISVLVAYITLVFVSLLHHELWRDEARVWYLVSFQNINELFDSVRYDGHPFLLYLLLLPFAKLKLPVIVMQTIALIISAAAVFLILFKVKTNYLIKIFFVFSAGMLWFIPVAVRNYVLIPFLGILWALLYPKRTSKPFIYTSVLILLSQTHMLIWGLSFIALFLFSFECLFSENKKARFFVPSSVLIYSLIIFYIYKPVFFNNIWSPKLASGFSHLSFYKNILNFNEVLFQHFLCPDLFLKLFLYSLIIILLFQLIFNRKIFFICVFSCLYLWVIISCVYFGGIYYQKIFILMLIPVFCTIALNLLEKKNNGVNGILYEIPFVLYMFSVFMTYSPDKILLEDFKNKVSGVKEISSYISDNKIGDSEYVVILLPYDFKLDTLYSYLPRTFSSKNIAEIENIEPENVSKIAEEIKQKNGNLKYIITQTELTENEYPGKYEQIISPNNIIAIPFFSDEFYYLYKLK